MTFSSVDADLGGKLERCDRMRHRRAFRCVLVACALATGCSSGNSTAGVPGPANSIDGQLPTLNDGEDLPPGETYAFVVGTHCGVRVLGRQINGSGWMTDEASQTTDWLPPEWAEAIKGGQELIALSVLLSADGDELIATAENVSVKYRPITDRDQVADCA